MILINHVYLVPKLRIRGLLPLYPLYDLMITSLDTGLSWPRIKMKQGPHLHGACTLFGCTQSRVVVVQCSATLQWLHLVAKSK
jgi:hypothetical protein